MDQPPSTTSEESWSFHRALSRPISRSWSSSDTSSSTSQFDSTESNSTYQESPFTATPLETPDVGRSENYFAAQVTAEDPPVVAVLGVGYVGLHLVTAFSNHYKVIAYDVSEKRLQTVAGQLSNANISLTSDPFQLAVATHFLVAVPTPLIPHTTRIDTSIIQNALKTVCDHIRPGATVVIESSVSVGMTRSLLGKIVQTHGIFGGMSPERVDPGRISPPYTHIPKIISGLDTLAPGSLASITNLYAPVFPTLIPVTSPEVAEMTKLYENCQRMLCIAYANEMADACLSLSYPIDPFEVSRAAATKPFGYLPFYPSAGVGGDCIPVNPGYLFSTSAFPVLEVATERMRGRPARLADRAMKVLQQREYEFANANVKIGNADADADLDSNSAIKLAPAKRQKILVVGVAFKSGQALTTNSPAVGIIKRLLDSWDAHVTFADPLVSEQALPYVPRLDEGREWNVLHLNTFDAIIVVMKQEGLDFDILDELEEKVVIVRYCQ